MDDSRSPLLKAEGICKAYPGSGSEIRILRDLDFSIDTQETVSIEGASGIGKSTLLHILGTLDMPDSGRLFFKGESLFELSEERMAEFRNQKIGFVFQFHHLLPEFTTMENVMMPALIGGISLPEARSMAEPILVRVGLKERLNHQVTLLSGGEQQRTALARALVMRPPLLLADEPTGNLDRKNAAEVHQLLMDLNLEMKMAMVVVTHNSSLASLMDRNLTILDGQLVEKEG